MIEMLFINSLYIFGLYNAVSYELDVDRKPVSKELLWFVSYYLKGAPIWVKKPLFGCVACMASVHSWPYWLINDVNFLSLCLYIIYIFALSGLNAIVYEAIIDG